jgi:hypothetical protein
VIERKDGSREPVAEARLWGRLDLFAYLSGMTANCAELPAGNGLNRIASEFPIDPAQPCA